MTLKVDNISVKIGQDRLLADIYFELQPRSITALVGHNGAGKSTLMRTIMLELELEKGYITLNGLSGETDLLEYKRSISYLPEEPLLFPELTAMQHFQLYANSYGIAEEAFQEKLSRLSEGFELTDKLNEFPESLSKGMRQKVQTICALLPDTELLLIDEPFMGLDIYAMDFLEELIREKAESGTMILLTSHQLERMKELADYFLLLQHGELLEQGGIEAFETIKRRTKNV